MKTLYCLKSPRMIYVASIAIAATIGLAGCTTTTAPLEQMAVSKAAIDNANSAGASELSPVSLKAAMEKMDAAEKAMARQDYEFARKLAEEAQVDAQLAAASARSAKTQKAADAIEEDSRVLRREIDRKAQ